MRASRTASVSDGVAKARRSARGGPVPGSIGVHDKILGGCGNDRLSADRSDRIMQECDSVNRS